MMVSTNWTMWTVGRCRYCLLAVLVTRTLVAQVAEQPVQTARVALLDIVTENAVFYRKDVSDPSLFGTKTTVTPPAVNRTFEDLISIGDIVSINGKPAKGVWTSRGVLLTFSPSPAPGSPIANFAGSEASHVECTWVLYTADGQYVGRLTDRGTFQHAVSGGGGAYFAARGQHFIGPLGSSFRIASVTEDPSLRQSLGGLKGETLIYVIPEQWPDIEVTAQGPSVFHSDFTLVTDSNPAHAGESLIVRAKGLGPTLPNLVPVGFKPFGSNPFEVVNSPVEATVGGIDAPVLNQIGWPGTMDLYRVDFRVPTGLPPGPTPIQLTVAWIPGLVVNIPVR